MGSVGFKEWAVVCEALGNGRQSIILRKGGIAEGADGFSFKHPEFFLFPTWFHEQPQKVRGEGIEVPGDKGAEMEIKFAAKLAVSHTITSWAVAEALGPLHILQPDVIRERFDYDAAPGLHVAFVRVFRLEPTWTFPNESRFGGCRSWVNLPDMPTKAKLHPALNDTEHQEVLDRFQAIVRGARL